MGEKVERKVEIFSNMEYFRIIIKYYVWEY